MLTNTQKTAYSALTPEAKLIHPQNDHAFLQNVNVISSLPPEMMQNIAFYLDSASYSQLRGSNREMHSNLPTFKHMEEQLATNISGDLEKNYRSIICDKHIREQFLDKTKRDTAQILKSCNVMQSPRYPTETIIEIPYFEEEWSSSSQKNGKVLNLCREEILNLSKKTLIPSGAEVPACSCTHGKTISKLFTKRLRMVKLSIDMAIDNRDLPKNQTEKMRIETKKLMTRERINFVFGAFNNTFNTCTDNEKRLIAISAAKLKNHWCNTPPENMHKNDILQLSSQYNALFSEGERNLSVLASIK